MPDEKPGDWCAECNHEATSYTHYNMCPVGIVRSEDAVDRVRTLLAALVEIYNDGSTLPGIDANCIAEAVVAGHAKPRATPSSPPAPRAPQWVVIWEPPINKGHAARVFANESEGRAFIHNSLEGPGGRMNPRIIPTSDHLYEATPKGSAT
jgi:hypothetical protein